MTCLSGDGAIPEDVQDVLLFEDIVGKVQDQQDASTQAQLKSKQLQGETTYLLLSFEMEVPFDGDVQRLLDRSCSSQQLGQPEQINVSVSYQKKPYTTLSYNWNH